MTGRDKFSARQLRFKDILDEAAAELGLTGKYSVGGKHDAYEVLLPNGEPVKMAVYTTPAGEDGYAGTLRARLRAHIHRHCERRGYT